MNVKIQKACEEDLTAIIDLYAQPDMDNNKVLSLDEAKFLFKRIESYPNYNIFVAKIENIIIGTFALLIMDNLAHLGAPSGIVEDVAVHPKFHRQGVGKNMMNFALNFCKKQGCYKLSLSSNIKRLSAHKFYESIGFKKHGVSFVADL